jgi:hypothetical protein
MSGRVKVSFAVSRERCHDILTSANEAGVHGSAWLRDYHAFSDYEGQGLERRCVRMRIAAVDLNAECNEPPVRRSVSARAIATALGRMFEEGGGLEKYAAQALGDNLDGPSADVVVQVAFFGKQVYA